MKVLVRLCVAVAVLVAGGCATPARVESMTASAADVSPLRTPAELRKNVAIRDVTGGKETNPMWVSSVGSSEFERALEASLQAAGMLAANRMDGKYVLVVHLENLEQPIFGASMTVTATVQYMLAERASGKTVFSRRITEPYTAAFTDSLLGVERLRLANEGAIRVNITKFIADLSGQKLSAAGTIQLAIR